MGIMPIMWIRKLKNIAYFSFLSNVATFIAIVLIIVVEINIINDKTINIGDDVKYESLKIIDIWQMPIYFGVTMCLYEGNGLILNLYSEVDKPNKFMNQVTLVLSIMTGLGIVIGSLSYMAFGNKVDSIVLYNLPNDTVGISIKLLYMLTIMGIYVLVIFPVF